MRGRGDGEFQAIAPAPDGGQLVLARSPRFRWRLPLVSPDATPHVAAAHATLVRGLIAAGWQPYGTGVLNWYAQRFRAPARAPVEPPRAAAPESFEPAPIVPETAPPAPVESLPPNADPELVCEIKWVRGRGDGEFQAIAPAPDGGQLVLARSPRFRWRLPLVSPDATPRAAAAHATLVRQLVAAGWQPCGIGLLNWYSHRFAAPQTFAAQSRTETDA